MTHLTAARDAVVCPRPVPGARQRLFLFHHAGGSHLAFRSWVPLFPPEWEICLMEAPGRGALLGAPPLDTVESLVAFFEEAIEPWADRPMAFFGHSMGALVAHELAHALVGNGLVAPSWLGVSACPPPRRAGPGSTQPPVPGPLTDDALRRRLITLGGTPPELLTDSRLWSMFAPALRADFTATATYRQPPGRLGPAVPLSVFAGRDDPAASPGELTGWAPATGARPARFHVFPGGHFYLDTHREQVAARIVADATEHLPPR
ncbi:thioesterase II family protein [Streptomyces sp. NPDC060184]|uniref:thioesterase II family protein n=1 Tax=Streptomyces sp. NPDC060184 TaxID=3347064 RepID=UPI003648C1E7